MSRAAISGTTPDRRQSRDALLELLTMLSGPLPGLPARPLLRDPAPDRGLFGPASITWRLTREPVLLLGGGRALLMQVAHPLVGQGVADHSDYAADPFGRLLATVRWVMFVIFGTTREAQAATRAVQRQHEHVSGVLATANATSRFGPATPYMATDPVLARWVHATIVESMLVAYERLVGPLAAETADRFVCEWNGVARMMGVEPSALWPSAAALHAYVANALADGTIVPVPASRQAAWTILHPVLPWPVLQPLAPYVAFLTTGLLPERLRRGYGLRWTARHERLHRAMSALFHAAHPYLPRKLRISPLYDLACARLGNSRET